MAALTVVSSSSVLSGAISLTAPTKVVLPTPNPPATRIFSAVGKGSVVSWPDPGPDPRP